MLIHRVHLKSPRTSKTNQNEPSYCISLFNVNKNNNNNMNA